MKAIKDEIGITTDEKKIRNIVNRLLDKDFFDAADLYTDSDMRYILSQIRERSF